MNFIKGRPWHTNALIVFLAVWASWSFVGMLSTLAGAPAGMLSLLDYYVFLSVPSMIAFAAYLLFVKNSFRIAPFLLLPVMYYWCAVRLYPALSPARWEFNAEYLAQIPLNFRIPAVFFLMCAIYCLVLNKQARNREN
jgi:hypothetical protein